LAQFDQDSGDGDPEQRHACRQWPMTIS
jgi:hypothetical protein